MRPHSVLQRGTASPRAKAWVIAGIMLALHWAAPGMLQLRVMLHSGDATGMSSAVRASQPGSLPRIQPRTVALDACFIKGSESGWHAGGKLRALPANDTAIPRFAASAPIIITGEGARGAVRARSFDARAPPALTA
jgi:hypothetical protein